MSKISTEILQIFQNQKICMDFRNEIANYGYVKSFQWIECSRFEFLKDQIPLALVLYVPFHPKINLAERLPKELCFQCFQNTKLENVKIRIIGEVVVV